MLPCRYSAHLSNQSNGASVSAELSGGAPTLASEQKDVENQHLIRELKQLSIKLFGLDSLAVSASRYWSHMTEERLPPSDSPDFCNQYNGTTNKFKSRMYRRFLIPTGKASEM
mmetsp:Transcript_17124/g.47040  ORF Transcript_17124/g.47040 Transcript_17124/m.47040 type:complete len:113 (+) Transcript_17124:606-944(+)